MRLSLQTVSIIFGVTLVHLCIITALSPRGSEGSLSVPIAPATSDFHGPLEDSAISQDEVSSDSPADATISPGRDTPALRRPASEPSAIEGDLPALPPRQFSPLPQS